MLGDDDEGICSLAVTKILCIKEINRSTGTYSISSEEFDDKILAPMKTSHLQVAVALLKNLSC